jgi:hypothetical protein
MPVVVIQQSLVTLIERKYPRWTIKEVQRILYIDRKNWEAIRELSGFGELELIYERYSRTG